MRRIRPGERDFQLVLFVGLVLIIAYLDYITGPNISLTLVYLIPVAGAGWFLGQWRAIPVALAAGVVSLVDLTFASTASDVPTAALVWNSVSRAVVLTLAAVLIARVRYDRERLVIQDVQRARSLELLDRGLSEPAKRLVDLAENWDGSVEALKKMVHLRADEIAFLARDFSSMVRLQSGELPLRPTTFDFVELIDELRQEQQTAERRILMTNPANALSVKGDRARIRQSLSSLISERAAGAELSFMVDKRGEDAELVITSGDYRPVGGAERAKDVLGMSVELAQLLFAAQGGSVRIARNPLTRSLRVTARLPLA